MKKLAREETLSVNGVECLFGAQIAISCHRGLKYVM